MRFVKILAAAIATAALAAPVAHANIVRSGNVFTQDANPCSCVTTIDGYLFSGMPYYDGSPAVDSAVELWWALAADPGYQPLPPITSVSTTTTVSGTVDPGDDDSGDDAPTPSRSYGTG